MLEDRVDQLMAKSKAVDNLTSGKTVLEESRRVSQFACDEDGSRQFAVNCPDRTDLNLSNLSDLESSPILNRWNATTRDYGSSIFVHEIFEQQVTRTPNAMAVVSEGIQLTYQDLNERSNRLAHYLHSHSVGPGALVGICMERSVDLIVALMGVLKSGGAYVPVDPAYPSERISRILAGSNVSIVLTHEKHAESIPTIAGEVVCVDECWNRIAKFSGVNPVCRAASDNLIYVIYTSGSTGNPKGAAVHHRGFANLIHWYTDEFQFTASDRVLLLTSISFDLTQKNVYGALCVGAQLHLAPNGLYDPQCIARQIETAGVTVLNCTPSHFYPLVSDQDVSLFKSLTSLRYVFLGGEPIEVTRLRQWLCHPSCNALLVNSYGPTECSDVVAYYKFRPDEPRHSNSVPIGRPISNVTFYIMDSRRCLVPMGAEGELYIGGTCVGFGYVNHPELTADRFVPDPFSRCAGARLYRTGDLVRYLDDGNIEFLGRLDHQVKVNGFRIELGEIETALRRHPSVRDALVIAREDSPGDQRLVGYLVPTEDGVPWADIRAFLKNSLPAFMVPSTGVWLSVFPLSPNGKVDRRALPIPGTYPNDIQTNTIAPSNSVEAKLCAIWEEALGIRPIGVTDNFLDLGGTSLSAARAFRRIQEEFGRILPISTLIQSPTVLGVAELLGRAHEDISSPSLIPIKPSGAKRPFFCIHGAGANVLHLTSLAKHFDVDQPLYGLQSQGLDGQTEPLTSAESMAAHYLEEIFKVQPVGPYFLGGLSFGGVIAFEMAQQLHRKGEKVAIVVLIDTNFPNKTEAASIHHWRFRQRIYPFVEGIELQLMDLKRQGYVHYLRSILKKTPGFVRRIVRRDLVGTQEYWADKSPTLRKICAANVAAAGAYAATPYAGRLTLLWATEWPIARILNHPDRRLYWSDVAQAGLEVHVVQGSHSSMRFEPHLGRMVQELNACLVRAHVEADSGCDVVDQDRHDDHN